ncbi:hypothetical protein SBRCBS47491_002215 [Sporothrix bragantina]|uniref:Uncharacterized protein n=1 Tax=Sporothrix bragantina TaxID=671064 RepID=A0ABP0B558_9PEZI
MKQLPSLTSTTSKHGKPLRAQAPISGVKKSRRTHRDSRSLPSWYYRVLNIGFKKNREVMGYDFDEDLSDMEEEKGQGSDDAEQSKNEEEDCTCGSEDSKCDCQIEDVDMDEGDDEDDKSERPYDGFDADYYYVMKHEREERKREKLQERKEKEQQQEMERAKEEEIHAAERTLNRAEKERKTIKVKSCDSKYELSFKFIGNGHLKLRVSRDMVFMDEYSASPPAPPPAAPKVFEFVGIWRDW